MASNCNVNWGRARSYMESAGGSFYDLQSEAPSYFTILTDFGSAEQKDTWSGIISEEANRALTESPVFDFEMQLSIDNMVLHGCGPLMFEDANKCLPKAFQCGDLKVPEFHKSETHYWDSCMVQASYFPPELYKFIEDEKYAKMVGWDVEFTKRVIANAVGIRNEAGIMYEWEFYQAEVKNNSLSYYEESKISRLAYVFYKEFDGRITQSIVERDSASGQETKFLYLNIGRYAKFSNVIHPMYFDHGNGGYHHSVTGLGVKMYGPMEYENRLICNLADKAFSPKLLFKPTTSEATQRLQMARFGDYATLPKGTEVLQAPVQGLMGDAIEFYELARDLNGDVLGSYRQAAPAPKSGNPVTKFEKQFQAAMQSALSKTQYNRYYKQLDMLYAEIYRRLSNLNSTCDIAKRFQQRCIDRGVPKEAINRIARIQATRVAGQGSGFMRKMAIDSLFQVAGALPEEGRNNLVRDKIAAEAGQHAVSRYFPQSDNQLATDQQVMANTEVVKMKNGMRTDISSNQNPVIFATVFVKAAQQSLQSLQRGGEPHEVLRFLVLCGPAIAAHLQRFQSDPTRKGIHEALTEALKQIAQGTDQLKMALAKQSKAQQEQAQKQNQVMSDQQLKAAKLKSDIQLKQAKWQAQLRQSAQRQQFDQALEDASTAHDMTLKRIKAFQE